MEQWTFPDKYWKFQAREAAAALEEARAQAASQARAQAESNDAYWKLQAQLLESQTEGQARAKAEAKKQKMRNVLKHAANDVVACRQARNPTSAA